jgi:hypothetical protein
MLVLDSFGCFKDKEYSMVPYRHHTSRHTWKVVITKKIFNEEVVDFEQESTTVFARTALEAAKMGREFFDRVTLAKDELREWEREERARQLARQLKRRDIGPEQTSTPATS